MFLLDILDINGQHSFYLVKMLLEINYKVNVLVESRSGRAASWLFLVWWSEWGQRAEVAYVIHQLFCHSGFTYIKYLSRSLPHWDSIQWRVHDESQADRREWERLTWNRNGLRSELRRSHHLTSIEEIMTGCTLHGFHRLYRFMRTVSFRESFYGHYNVLFLRQAWSLLG